MYSTERLGLSLEIIKVGSSFGLKLLFSIMQWCLYNSMEVNKNNVKDAVECT